MKKRMMVYSYHKKNEIILMLYLYISYQPHKLIQVQPEIYLFSENDPLWILSELVSIIVVCVHTFV